MSMSSCRVLISQAYSVQFLDDLKAAQAKVKSENGVDLSFVVLPDQPRVPGSVPFQNWVAFNPLSKEETMSIDAAYISEDVQMNWQNMLGLFGVIKEAPNIKWVQISWIGIDFPVFKDITPKAGLVITNAAGTNALPVATSTVAAILSLNRGLHFWLQDQHHRKWGNREKLPLRRDLPGQKVLIFGFGAIGEQIGRMCKGLGLKVVAVKRSAPEAGVIGVSADDVVSPDNLKSILPTVDFVVVSSPLTEETRGTFDRGAFALMKPTAFFLNVGRGPVADEAALLECLQQNKIAGAYLDVFEKEPLPSSSPFWDLPNVILSPHDSATCFDNGARVQKVFMQNLLAFCAQSMLVNQTWPPPAKL
eukprot:gnl/MRDRNA2_/MRDRNA2_164315_c0_seq1.p1 gnl/MRDRNA2_/MRDRNA2_164315_c0~~gnl/MRDRNA2_/MRDRNA2_164315_c0_seq1.p1  ORF type:complete len:362 (-),score=53.17 gnl/MRDRNA2_/MRDRNA2_164315_c0_seq1:37-1122(-)